MSAAVLSSTAAIASVELQPMLDQVLEWTAVNSGTRNLHGLSVIADLLRQAFATLPGETELVSPEPAEAVSAAGEIVPIAAGRHLVLRVRPAAERRVLLTGHMDTVYAIDDPFQSCTWLDDRRLRGPGVLDMKSGIAVMLAGLRAFEAMRPRLGYDVLINSDEETGSASSSTLIAGLARGKFAALTYEPSLPGGIMARSRPGSGNFSAIVTGRSAHAGRNPEEGRNSVVAAADLALRLAAARRPGLAINPARIDGGGPNNVVPAHAVLRFNVRPKTSEQMLEAADLITRLAAEVGAAHDVAINVHGGIGRPAKPVDQSTERLFSLVRDAAMELGDVIDWRDSGGVCDGNNIASYGVPVIDTMGARGEFIHSPDEYLDTSSLVPKARLTTLVLCHLEASEGLK